MRASVCAFLGSHNRDHNRMMSQMTLLCYLVQVQHPIDYARVVQRIGNEMDLTQVELEDLLPAASVMVVTVTATTTAGKQLSDDLLAKTMQGCEMALQLDDDKQQVGEGFIVKIPCKWCK